MRKIRLNDGRVVDVPEDLKTKAEVYAYVDAEDARKSKEAELQELSDAEMQASAEQDLINLFGETAEPSSGPAMTQEQMINHPNLINPNRARAKLRGDYVPADPSGASPQGAFETGLAMLSGATSGAAGQIAGTLYGMGERLAGQYEGDPYAQAQQVKDRSDQFAGALTYNPQSRSGQEMTSAAIDALSVVEPLVAVTPQLQTLGAARSPVRSVRPGADALEAVITNPLFQETLRSSVGRSPSRQAPLTAPTSSRSIGAAETEKAAERVATAQSMPIPFEGDSGLTYGQATRAFEQQQFEAETAKIGGAGAPIRDRKEKQQEVMRQNIEALKEVVASGRDGIEPYGDDAQLGRNAKSAVEERRAQRKAEVDESYEIARESGEMDQLLPTDSLRPYFDFMDTTQTVAPGQAAIKLRAKELGIIDDEGNFLPASINVIEEFRQFVNQFGYDAKAQNQNKIKGEVALPAIDEVLNQAPETSQLYGAARRNAAKYYNEFKDTPLNKRMTNQKFDTNEDMLADEKVWQQTVLNSSIDQMNNVRSTLNKTEAGRKSWSALKDRTIQHIMDKAYTSSTGESGNEVLSPASLLRVIEDLDKSGKLVSLFGKRQAQTFRDLAELSQVMMTHPPGSVNFSNTGSAITAALAEMILYTSTIGIPLPLISAVRGARMMQRNAKQKTQVQRSLNTDGLLSGEQN